MRRYQRNDLLRGIRVARGAPIISHMLFADDSYILCRVSNEEAARVVSML